MIDAFRYATFVRFNLEFVYFKAYFYVSLYTTTCSFLDAEVNRKAKYIFDSVEMAFFYILESK
jgi:hypothetical protein